MKLTVRTAHHEGVVCREVVARLDPVEPLVPIGQQRHVASAADPRFLAAGIEPLEHRHRQAVVVPVAGGDDLAVAGDGFGHAADRAFVQGVGERLAGDLARRIPAGGEDRVAGAQGVSRLRGHAADIAGELDAAGLGEDFEKGAAGGGGPAVLADGGGHGADGEVGRGLRQRVGDAEASPFGDCGVRGGAGVCDWFVVLTLHEPYWNISRGL